METNFCYQAAIAIIGRQLILRSKAGGNEAAEELEFLSYYSPQARAVLYGSRNVTSRFPSDVKKLKGQIVVCSESADLWLSGEDDDDDDEYCRGDFCFYSDVPPLFAGFSRAYEPQVIWNSSAVVPQAVEKWSRNSVGQTKPEFAVLHTNKIAGGGYFFIRASLSGMVVVCDRLLRSMKQDRWLAECDPIDSAIADARAHWANRWFMDPSVLQESIAAAKSLVS